MPVYTTAVTIPANTPESNPVKKELTVYERYVTSIEVFFPYGCAGLTRIRCYYGSEQIAPKPTGSDFRGDGGFVKSPMHWKTPEWPCPLRFECWNLDDTYPHTPILFVITAEEEEVPAWTMLRDLVSILKRILGLV